MMIHQFASQPIEQFRMTRRRPIASKIAGRVDDAGAEVELPQPVDDHAGCKRIVPAGNPVRQGQSAFAFGRVERQIE